VVRSFQRLKQIFGLVVMRKSKFDRRHLERFPRRWLHGQTQTQEVIDDLLERASRSPYFSIEQPGDVIIEGQSSSHIMMLNLTHHDVND